MVSLNRRGRAWVLCLLGLAYPVLIVVIVDRLAAIPYPERGVLPTGLAGPLAVVLAVMAAINVVTPWARRSRWRREAAEMGAGGDAAYRSLVLGLPFAAAPASYGLLLYVLTAQPASPAYFAGASFVAAAAWSAQTLLARP